MPLYEYRCLECTREFELLLRGAGAPSCPFCRSDHLERALSNFAVSSAERSKRALAVARTRYARDKNRVERLRNEGQEIREHLQEDYGVDLSRSTKSKRKIGSGETTG